MHRMLALTRLARHAPSLTTLIKRQNLIKQAQIPFALYWSTTKILPSRCEEAQEEYLTLQALPKSHPVIEWFRYSVRFVQLAWIFAPSVLCLPLCLFQSTRQIWLDIFLNAVCRAGIIWIKAFQYLSHRGDVIGQEIARKMSVLRENSPTHSWQHTRDTIHRVYGMPVDQMFEEFGREPIASGSVSQVYRAKLNGQEVAVKVRHPDPGNNLTRDIELLFSFSHFFSMFSSQFQVPVTDASLKKILSQQLLFLNQKKNIDKLGTKDIDPYVRVPKTYPQSTNQVLIQEFIHGRTIAHYHTHPHQLNKVMANIGARAYYSMLLKHNFVHADCHGGNILVTIKQAPEGVIGMVGQWAQQVVDFCIAKYAAWKLELPLLGRLAHENYLYESSINQAYKNCKDRLSIVLIDVGMAVRLTPIKKQSFQSFLSEIVKGDAKQCAKWIYRISQRKGINIPQGQHPGYLSDLQKMFTRVHKTALQNLDGMTVVRQILEVIRKHNMKIDGEISILLTNMLILESIAKKLDPQMNILRSSVPYLRYQ